jgi:uncharacterized damage-inducible protein DinB
MYRELNDFIEDWKYESESTLRYFQAINSNVLDIKLNENIRSIGRLCWHITITISEMMNKTGLQVSGPAEHSQPPATMQEIINAYQHSSASLVSNITSSWNNSSLLEEKEMYGEKWSVGKTLSVLITHQVHHRGQLSVLMREQGIKVPGIYGPAKEEWAQWQMPAAE